jgi:CubicO group peptidase (beta-lactamase class C family)
LWSPDVLADGTGTVRNTYPDPGQGGIPANRTRGLVVAGDDGHAWRRVNFGRTVSARTFGHDGAFGQIAWADPVSGLSFAYLTNGLDRHNVRLGHRGLDLSGLAGLCTTP